MNKVFLIGRLVRDPELRFTGSNIAVATSETSALVGLGFLIMESSI